MAEQRKPKPIDDVLLHGAHILIIDARFHEAIADELVAGATEFLQAAHVHVDRISVPGSLEIPVAAAIEIELAHRAGRVIDGIVALGCVIRGETAHFDIVARESARALLDLGMSRHMPVGNGILTVDTEAQALERASRKGGNKGGAAAEAVLVLLKIARTAGEKRQPWR
jgi:6,7-dimethyl-8-ribityllumazine synthase